ATEKSPVAWFFNGSKFRAPWRRVLLDDKKQIMFKQLRQRDSGVYECTLLGVKVGHLELHGRGIFSVLPRYYAAESQHFDERRATQKSPVAWFFNGSKFRAPWRRVLLDDKKQIVFKQLRQRDSGVYECTLLGVKVGHLELHDSHMEGGQELGVVATKIVPTIVSKVERLQSKCGRAGGLRLVGSLVLPLFSASARFTSGVLDGSDGMWMSYVTIVLNLVVYAAVIAVNSRHHYKRMAIQEYLAQRRSLLGSRQT
ncbi:hypothetical protein HPB47_001314, partial [Ixodes persulcatus]